MGWVLVLLLWIAEVDGSIRGVRFAGVGCDLMVGDMRPGVGSDPRRGTVLDFLGCCLASGPPKRMGAAPLH